MARSVEEFAVQAHEQRGRAQRQRRERGDRAAGAVALGPARHQRDAGGEFAHGVAKRAPARRPGARWRKPVNRHQFRRKPFSAPPSRAQQRRPVRRHLARRDRRQPIADHPRAALAPGRSRAPTSHSRADAAPRGPPTCLRHARASRALDGRVVIIDRADAARGAPCSARAEIAAELARQRVAVVFGMALEEQREMLRRPWRTCRRRPRRPASARR